MTSTARTILESLVKVPSVTGEEMRLADTVAGWCRAAGLETVLREIEPGRPNVVAHRRTGRRPVLLMTGHLDTVPVGEGWTRDPFGADVESGRLYGRGASDMKAGLAAMLAALVDLHAAGEQPAGDVVFAGVIGEEEDSAGTLALIADGITADRALLAEPTALELIRSGRGLVNYTLTIAGASAHASSPQLGRNAIVAAAHVVQALEQLSARLAERPHPAFGPPNLTVGTIHGGTRPYVVPDLCVVEVDRRVNPGESPEMVRAEAEVVLDVAVLDPDVVLDAVGVPGACALPPHPARMPTLAARRTSRLDLAMRWTAPPRGCCDDVLTVQTVSSTAPPVIRHEEASSLRLIM